MKITRSLDRDGTLGPLALNYLAGIPQQHIFSREQQLRHPASIYDLSLEKLSRAFAAVTEGYKRDTARLSVTQKELFDLKALLDTQEHLLRCLQEHLDDCYLILKTFVNPATTTSKSDYAEQYVLDSKLPGIRGFRDAAADYKTSLRIANLLKHNQGRLRGVGIYPGDDVYLGYYLEGPDKTGVLGPSPEIHPNRGAFSFARDLKWRFFLVYSLSESLTKAVQRAFAGLHQISIGRDKLKLQSEEWDRLTSAISKIPRAIFPKEMDASVATIQVSEDEKELSIKFPDRVRILYPSFTGRAVVSTVGDGFSTQFNVPFP